MRCLEALAVSAKEGLFYIARFMRLKTARNRAQGEWVYECAEILQADWQRWRNPSDRR